MIYELRTYTLHPGKAPEFIQHAGGIAMPIRGERYGKLAGYWSTDVGTLNQVLHLWAYDDMAHRTRARAELGKNERWNAEYVPKILPLLRKQENTILIPADFKPVEPSAQGHGVYEFRTYRLYPGRCPTGWRPSSPVWRRARNTPSSSGSGPATSASSTGWRTSGGTRT